MAKFIQKSIPGIAPDKPFVKGNKNPCFRPKLLDYVEKKLGIAKNDFAKMLGVSNATITKWLYSSTSPSMEKTHSIARALGLSFEEVYDLFEVACPK